MHKCLVAQDAAPFESTHEGMPVWPSRGHCAAEDGFNILEWLLLELALEGNGSVSYSPPALSHAVLKVLLGCNKSWSPGGGRVGDYLGMGVVTRPCNIISEAHLAGSGHGGGVCSL